MAMEKCKECGNDISTKAESCPKCGTVLKRKTGCLKYIGAGVFILFVLAMIGSFLPDTPTGVEFVFVKGGCYDMGDTFGDGGVISKSQFIKYV